MECATRFHLKLEWFYGNLYFHDVENNVMMLDGTLVKDEVFRLH